ncbi:B12-binding domain-containing radical SAM protein [bacterium]|nr:B12-binding domain-containing radical SAM protein [bacterium]
MHKNENFKVKLISFRPHEISIPYRLEVINNPYYNTLMPRLPHGLGVITAFLRKHGYNVKQDNFSQRFKNIELFKREEEVYHFIKSGDIKGQLNLFIDKIVDNISIKEFDVIGFSVISYSYFIFSLMLCKKIKQKSTIPIVFGGAFISIFGKLYPDVFNPVDYMIIGDGRIPLLKLINYLQGKTKISEVPNLIYKDNSKIITNFKECYLLEDIPVPDFDGLPIDLYQKHQYGNNLNLPYQISRGCTTKCSFCTFTSKYELEFKSYNKILRELVQMKKKYNSKLFQFCDDEINNSYEYLEELCNLFIKNKLDINWGVFAKIGNLDRHILKKMKKAGCLWLAFGIESGSDNILRMMNKGFTSEQASKTLKDASQTGLRNAVFLMTGYPHETQEDIQQTVKFIRKNKRYIHNTYIFKFRLLYNSRIYCNPERYGIVNLTKNYDGYSFSFDEVGGLKWEQKQKQQKDSQKQILKAGYKNANFLWKLKIFFLHSKKLQFLLRRDRRDKRG